LYTGRKQKEHSFVGARAQGLKPATCVTTTSRLRIAAIFEAHHHKGERSLGGFTVYHIEKESLTFDITTSRRR
jgi:hypothetical protein